MSDFLTFLVAGVTVGSAYALVAVGLVLTYKASGILNFAQGGLAIVAVDAYIYFTVNLGWSWELGAVASVVGVGALMGLALEPLGRLLRRAAPAHRVVAMIGLLIAIESGSGLIGPYLAGSTPHQSPPPLPGGTVLIAGVYVGEDQITIMAVTLLAAIVLWAFLSRTRSGISMRAVVVNPDLLDLSGNNSISLRRIAWIIGATFASLSGVLLALAPSFGPSPQTVDLLIVPSFGAAAIGAFNMLPLAYAGGLIVGIIASLLTRYTGASWLQGLSGATPFVILFAVLLFIPRRVLSTAEVRVPFLPRRRQPIPPWLQVAAGSIVGAVVLSVPAWSGFEVSFYTTTLIYVVLFLSLGLLLKTAGMVSLCQLGFAAVGAATFGHVASNTGIPWFFALALSVLVSAAIGTLVALPAIRLPGVFLALATVGFGYILEQLFYPSSWMFGVGGVGYLTAPRPAVAASNDAYYYLVVGFVALSVGIVFAITRSRLGRMLRGLADSPLALQVQGASTTTTRLLVFAISAGLAGMSGALFGSLNDYISPSAFSADSSLTLVVVLFVLSLNDPWYAFAAAIAYYLIPAKLQVANIDAWVSLGFGLLAISVVVNSVRSRTWVAPWKSSRRRLLAPVVTSTITTTVPAVSSTTRPSARGHGHTGLRVVDLTVRFGGVVALDSVSLVAPQGTITGLIGPNGAGKSTLLNVCSGIVHPSKGAVMLDDIDISGIGVPGRARRGLGRTFQQLALFESMSVRQAVALGEEAFLAGANPIRHLVGRSPAASSRSTVGEALELSGLDRLADQLVGDLSSADRRHVELARCLSGHFDMLLLDEPAAGLDRGESDRFRDTLRSVVEARGVGVLIVEHDVSLVMGLCSHIAVLDFGRLIFEGTPDAVRASPAVRSAYLGVS